MAIEARNEIAIYAERAEAIRFILGCHNTPRVAPRMTTTAITGPALLGASLEAVADASVVIEDNVITAAGASSEIAIPSGAERVDLAGQVLAPGFIDAHVHIGFYEPRAVLAGGVTTVRDLGWPPDDIFELAAMSGSDGFEGPTILAAGPMLTAPGGYPARAAWAPAGTALEVDSPAAAREAVDSLAARSTIVKIALHPPVGPVLDDETLNAITSAAHDNGLRVTGHISGLDQLERALDAGVDELAHMLMSPQRIPDELLERMVAAGTTIVPTLSIRSGRDRTIAVDNLARFHAAGGRVVYGTDLGNEGPRPGIDPSEVGAMAAAGMSLIEIIRAATLSAAELLGLNAGAIAAGRDADLVAFEGAIDDGPRLLQRVVRVWRRGRAVT